MIISNQKYQLPGPPVLTYYRKLAFFYLKNRTGNLNFFPSTIGYALAFVILDCAQLSPVPSVMLSGKSKL